MKTTMLLISFVLLTFNAMSQTVLSGDLLFQEPAVYSMKLNPSGTHIVSFEHQKRHNVLILTDTKTSKTHEIMSIAHKEKLTIQEYLWIDNQTILVKTNKSRGFLHLEISGREVKTRWEKLRLNGHIVSTLPEEENSVIFANQEEKRIVLYKASTQQLEQQDLSQAIALKNELRDALIYQYDDNNKLLLAARIKDEKVEFWFLKSTNDTWKKFFTLEQGSEFSPVGLLDENTMAVITNTGLDTKSLVEFNIDTETFGKILYQHPTYDLIDAELNQIGSGVKLVRYIDHGLPKTHYFSSSQQILTEELRQRVNDKNMIIVDASSNDDKKILASFSASNPGKYYFYDHTSDKITFIKSTQPKLDDVALSSVEVFNIKVNETNIEALLSRPIKDSNGVLLVYPHGGPVGVQDYSIFNPEVQYFTSRGYSVLNVNFRGSSGYGKSFLEKGKAQFGQLIEQDISAAVSAVNIKYQYKQMCSIGSSYGGYSAVMLAIYHPKKYRCVVSMYGIYDLPLLFNASNIKAQETNRAEVAKIVGKLDDSLKTISPFYFAQKLNSPTLLIAGKEDEIADFEQANRMKYRLKQLNKNIDYVFYDGVGHGHHNWYGEKIQAAYVEHFIRTQLDIKPLSLSNTKETLAQEYMMLGDSYASNDYVEDDEKKAYEFYSLAAHYGDNEAMYNIGRFYQQGIYVEKDIHQALQWYKKSSDAGLGQASNNIAKIYYTGEYIEADFSKSFEYFLKSAEQFYEHSNFGIARAYCLGHGVAKSFSTCLDKTFYLTDEFTQASSLDNTAFKKWRKLITEIIWKNKFSASEYQEFLKHLFDEIKLDVTDIITDDVTYGLFERDTRLLYMTDKIHQKTTNVIELAKGTTFGVDITFANNDKSVDLVKAKSIIKIIWRLPETIKNQENQKTRVISTTKDYGYYWSLIDDKDLVAGKYTLEIFSLDDKLLFSKTFIVENKK